MVKSKIFAAAGREGEIFEFGGLVRQKARELTGLSVRPRSGPTYLPQACCSIRRTPLPTYADGQSGDNRPPSWQGARTLDSSASQERRPRGCLPGKGRASSLGQVHVMHGSRVHGGGGVRRGVVVYKSKKVRARIRMRPPHFLFGLPRMTNGRTSILKLLNLTGKY